MKPNPAEPESGRWRLPVYIRKRTNRIEYVEFYRARVRSLLGKYTSATVMNILGISNIGLHHQTNQAIVEKKRCKCTGLSF